jgi:hypothetical protein
MTKSSFISRYSNMTIIGIFLTHLQISEISNEGNSWIKKYQFGLKFVFLNSIPKSPIGHKFHILKRNIMVILNSVFYPIVCVYYLLIEIF